MSDKFSLKDSQNRKKGFFSPKESSGQAISKDFSTSKQCLSSVYGNPGELPSDSPFFKKRKQGKAIQMAAIQVSLASSSGISPFSARAALSQSQNPSHLFSAT